MHERKVDGVMIYTMSDEQLWLTIVRSFKGASAWPSTTRDGGPLKVEVFPPSDFGFDIDDDDGFAVSIASIIMEAGDYEVQYSGEPDGHPDKGIVNDADRAVLEAQLVEIEAAIAYVRNLYNDNARPVVDCEAGGRVTA